MHMPPLVRLMLLLAPLGGCAAFDPFTREGVWRPTGSNEANLQSMLENPNDLIAGRGATGSYGQTATQAVERLRNDRVRGLPASGLTTFAPAGTSGGAGGSSAPSGF